MNYGQIQEGEMKKKTQTNCCCGGDDRESLNIKYKEFIQYADDIYSDIFSK